MPDAKTAEPAATYGGVVPAPKEQWIAERPQNQPLIRRRYESPSDLESAIVSYLDECSDAKERPRMTRLALRLGLDRRTLWEYVTGKREGLSEAWLGPLKRAWAEVEDGYESMLWSGKPVGAIFALKNMGWSDVPEREAGNQGVQVQFNVTFTAPDSASAQLTQGADVGINREINRLGHKSGSGAYVR